MNPRAPIAFTQQWKSEITHTNQSVFVFKTIFDFGMFLQIGGLGEPRPLSVLVKIICLSLGTKLIKNPFMNTSDLKNMFYPLVCYLLGVSPASGLY
jgi:hypothetical protein